MASKYDFRILIDTIDGVNLSYGTASFVEVQPNTSLVVNTDEMVDKINNLPKVQFFNGKTYATASSLFVIKGSTQFSGSTGVGGGPSDYQFVSASIKGNSDSGSILFHANNVANNNGDFIKRYKFFGNKVCNVLGVPENYWIYADKFRFTNTGSEQNYISGDVLAQSLHLRDNFAISNAGAIESDLPMKHAKDTDRWLKWTDVSSSIPQNDMLIGYSNQSDEYMIRMQNNKNLIISSSGVDFTGHITASGNISSSDKISGRILDIGGGNITTAGAIGLRINMTDDHTASGSLQVWSPNTTENTRMILGVTSASAASSGRGSFINTTYSTGGTFALRFLQGGTEKMRIDHGGNVGIGTASPTTPLYVNAGANNQTIATFTGNNTGRGLEISTYQESNHDAGVIIDATDNSHGTLKFQTTTTDAMIIDKTQNVGIGTTSPSAKLDVSGDISVTNITASGDISASGNLLVGERSSTTDVQNLSNISCYSDTANNIMIVQTDNSVTSGQYIGGIGFVGSDGLNSNSHPTSSNSAIMSRAALTHTTGEQATGLEFRIKNIDKLDNPVTNSIAYRINPFKHGDSENLIVYGDSGNDRINAEHEFVGSTIFKTLPNIGTSNNSFLTQSSWNTQDAQYGTDRGRIGFYWNKTAGDGEIDIFTHRGAATSDNDEKGGFDVYDIDPGNNTEKILSVRRAGIFGHQPWHKTAYHQNAGADTNPCFIDWTGIDTNIDTFTSGPQQGLVMPFDGYIRRLVYKPDNATNNTVFQFYKIGTLVDITELDSNTFGASKSANIVLANLSTTVDFDSTYSFSEGDVIGLSIDPTGDAGFGMLTVTFMCNVTS